MQANCKIRTTHQQHIKRNRMNAVITTLALIIFGQPQVVKGDGHIVLRLTTFRDPNGLIKNGEKCDRDGTACDIQLRGCISTNKLPKKFNLCFYTSIETKQYDNQNNVDFDENTTDLVFHKWTGHVGLDIVICDIDGPDCALIDHLNMFYPLKISAFKPTYQNYSWSGNVSTINFTIEVYCSQYYYGKSCSVYCNTNNGTEHFTCNKTTGKKECFTNYYGVNCKTYCKSPTANSHYYCNNITGSKICMKGWNGVECNLSLSSTLRSSYKNSAVESIFSSFYYITISPNPSSINVAETPISTKRTGEHESPTNSISFHQSILCSLLSTRKDYHNKTSVMKGKSGRWITSTVSGITTLCFVIICCMVVVILFMVLFVRDRKFKVGDESVLFSKKDTANEEGVERSKPLPSQVHINSQ